MVENHAAIPESASSQKHIALPKYFPEIPLVDEMERQRLEATERIAVPLGIDRNNFLAQLPPRFPDKPDIYDELRLTIPLISPDLGSLRFSWLQVAEAANFYNPNDPDIALKAYIWTELRKMCDRDELRVWKDPRWGVRSFPRAPHGVWIQDGSRYLDRNSVDVRRQLHKVERTGDHWKGIGLSVLRPDLVQKIAWEFIGGQLRLFDMPAISWYNVRPEFRFGKVVGTSLGCPLVCGSEFTVA